MRMYHVLGVSSASRPGGDSPGGVPAHAGTEDLQVPPAAC